MLFTNRQTAKRYDESHRVRRNQPLDATASQNDGIEEQAEKKNYSILSLLYPC